MASIEVIIRDEAGNILHQHMDRDVELSELSLRGVERAVEGWRQKALPEVTAGLLETAQATFTVAQKINQQCVATDDDG